MDVGTDVRTIFSEPKFLGCIDDQMFLPMVVRCARFAYTRAPLKRKLLDTQTHTLFQTSSLLYHFARFGKFWRMFLKLNYYYYIIITITIFKFRKSYACGDILTSANEREIWEFHVEGAVYMERSFPVGVGCVNVSAPYLSLRI